MTQQSGLSTFVNELGRRRVFRVAAFYGGIAFVIVQIIDGTFEVMGIPPWVSRLLIVLLGLGFPVAMGLAWAFDITPEGIVRTKGRTTGKPGTSNKALIAVTLFAVAFGIWGRWGGQAGSREQIRSIAVLPLDNLMGDPNQDYFVDGMHEALINNLSRIGALKVISRTSTLGYRNSGKRMPQIASELGVDAIVEGSVFRDGNRVRITAQLIHGRSDEHLWSSDYERDLDDIIALQNEVATAIAEEIKIAMTPGERARLAESRKISPEAYEWYLRGNDYIRNLSFMIAGRKTVLEQAVKVYKQALDIDPYFAAAHARLSYTYTSLYFYHNQPPEVARSAKTAVDRALELDATLPEAHLALGYYHNLVNRNYDEALEAFSTARSSLRGSSEIIAEIAHVQMRQGQWEQSLDNFQRAAELGPRSPGIQGSLATIYNYLRRYTEAEKVLHHLMTLTPDMPMVYANQIALALLSGGGIDKARKIIRASAVYMDPVSVMGLGSQLIYRLGFWRYGLLDQSPEEIIQTLSHIYPQPRDQLYYFSMAQIHTQAQQPEMSAAYYDSVRVWVENRLAGNPDSFTLQADLGLAMAFLGRKEEAIQAGQRSKELLPISACHW
ncbi:MAG: tetratricopeptide repeat protein [Candidatus Marinimicrobia bacterium]|nr:tetratricopeptide repeat protein [Candidatus Neomarinimicrobiota bacterium]